ncbi:unnamed protein product [Medioppia subpectinata]|uniref:Solute carrier organic anion transporter family member n=1 Tax=Medioppia subpectinata TaxID=1979941 RepID=A0A7R9KFP7_9ACAR|nr:unnamed protein product [Medioppia subpectinata]CAG2102524.1 unnamed protein product [Medioppia subpectinata]
MYGPGVHLLSLSGRESVAGNNAVNTSALFCDANRAGDKDYCNNSNNVNSDTVVSDQTFRVLPAIIMLAICSFCNGIGFVAFTTIGYIFVDDSVKKKNAPIYLGLTGAIRLCGPTFAYVLSSYCLRFYENPFFEPGIGPNDPRWIGAWWIGFIIIGTIIILFSIPMFMFPRSFLISKRIESQQKQNTDNMVTTINAKKTNKLSIWGRILRLLKNPIYVCYTLGSTLRLFSLAGYGTFNARYIESQYHTSASTANLFSGVLGVIPMSTGYLLGGLIVRKFLPGPRLLITFITAVELLSAMGIISGIFLECPQSQFAGTSLSNTDFQFQSKCNDNCFCEHAKYQPICGPDNQTNYFSPCIAGCRTSDTTNTTHTKYTDCNCFDGSATDGYCTTDCGNNLFIYVLMLGIGSIICYLAKVGSNIVCMRIVDKEDKSFAIAMIPYPIIYGSVVDGSCLIWESRCGQRGNCWVYDTHKLQRNLHLLTLAPYLTVNMTKMTKWTPVVGLVHGSPGIVQNMSATYLIAVLTSLEKRFAFDSKISGIILIADNVMEMILSPIVGYLGNRFSRPRMIALSELVLILSCVVNASPYFFYGPGTHLLYENSVTSKMFTNTTRYEVCAESRDSVDCSASGGHSTVWLAVFILILGSALRGIGYSAFWCFGVPFIDDSVSKENSPIYMSFLVILRMFGPAGVDPGVTRTDPRFIGAWWIGFLAIGFILFFINMPMFLFPAQLKGTTLKEITSKDKSGRGIWVCAKRLATNPLFMFNMIGNGLRYSGFAGYGITKPKYMESQYRVSGSKATLLTGVAGMVPDAIGILVGGVVIKYFKPKPLTLIVYMFAIEWVGNGGMLASMFTMNAECNAGCDCSTSIFTPICSADRMTTYFSPCYAGCKNIDRTTGIIPGMISATARTVYIPYPIVFGAIADSACLVYESTCGKTGNCWLYDQDRFRYVLHGFTLTLIIMGSLFDLGIIAKASRIKNFYDDDSDDNKDNTVNNNDL